MKLIPIIPLIALTGLVCGHALAAEKKPLKVFILAGQSNMQGHAHVRTIEHIGMDPATKPMLADMLNADGSAKVCERVWISAIRRMCSAANGWNTTMSSRRLMNSGRKCACTEAITEAFICV